MELCTKDTYDMKDRGAADESDDDYDDESDKRRLHDSTALRQFIIAKLKL